MHGLATKLSISKPLFRCVSEEDHKFCFNLLKVVAEAQLFMTLFLSVILRVSTSQLDNEVLNEDQYGTILVVIFFAAPSVALIITARKVVEFIKARKNVVAQNDQIILVTPRGRPAATENETHDTSWPEDAGTPLADRDADMAIEAAHGALKSLDSVECAQLRGMVKLHKNNAVAALEAQLGR